jgi:membrane associated rhomboid family serine protease
MLNCPRCKNRSLLKKQTTKGYLFECLKCEGRALTFELQKIIGGESAFFSFRDLLSRSRLRTDLSCPSCRKPMSGLELDDQRVVLDACSSCEMTWFDRAEFDHYNQQHQGAALTTDWPGSFWNIVPGILRLPVERTNPMASVPWMTISLVSLMLMIHFLSFSNLDQLVENWGFYPDQPFRHDGLNLITSLFIHGSWAHVLGNSYALFIYGDNVEDRFSHRMYLMLFFLAGVVGSLAHSVFDPRGDLPLVGASGAISGVMTVYCLSFPKARLASFFLIRWLSYPAWVYAIIWILFQVIGAAQQAAELTMVSYAGHLGGALVGLMFYLAMRDKPRFKLR